MERLTHDSYVVQAARLPEHRSKDRLNELLGIFEQRYFTNEERTEKRYSYEPAHEEVREMCKTLSSVIADPDTREQLYAELEYYRQRRNDAREDRVKLEEAKKEIEEKDKVIEEKDKVIEKNVKALGEKDKAIEEKDKVIAAAQAKNDSLEARVAALERRNNGQREIDN
jgi:membrane protein involved in colicin uptake